MLNIKAFGISALLAASSYAALSDFTEANVNGADSEAKCTALAKDVASKEVQDALLLCLKNDEKCDSGVDAAGKDLLAKLIDADAKYCQQCDMVKAFDGFAAKVKTEGKCDSDSASDVCADIKKWEDQSAALKKSIPCKDDGDDSKSEGALAMGAAATLAVSALLF